MAGKSAILSVKILTDASKGQKGLDQAASGYDKFGAGVKKAAVPAAIALAAIGAAATKVIAQAEATSTANARLTNVFQSMGETTGRAADEAIRYAEALGRQTGIDANTIKLTQAKLATFSAVSDESARMAGVFDRATNAAADLAAAGFGSMEGNAVQLGKALQDPTKGLTALAKSGVTFSDQEKRNIAAMQASGDMLGAQAVLLAAVETQVGGTALATANASDKMSEGWRQAQSALGTLLLPAFEALTVWVGKATTFVQDHAGAVVAITAVVAGLAAAIIAVNIAMKAYAAAQAIIKAASVAWTVVQWALNVALNANPIGLVVLAIAAFVGAIILAYNKSETFRTIVQALFTYLASAMAALVAAFQAFGRGVAAVWDSVTASIKSAIDWIAAKIAWLMDKLNAVKNLIPGLSGASMTYAAPSLSYAAAGYGTTSTYVDRSRTVHVSGAIDPVATARQVRRLLGDDDKRFGR